MRRWEVCASGIDEYLQGLSTDPYATTTPSGCGLRVPTLASPNRYLFQLAAIDVDSKHPIRLLGWRQLVTIGCALSTSTDGVTAPYEIQVVDPFWHFLDGNWSFHIVSEPYGGWRGPFGPVGANFAPSPEYARGSALLYGSFTATNLDALGAPLCYPNTLTSYTPPAGIEGCWEDVCGLSCVRDLRTTYVDSKAWDSLDVTVYGPKRLALYASVLQTNPATRPVVNYPENQTGAAYEDFFLQQAEYYKYALQVWRVGGSLIVEGDQ